MSTGSNHRPLISAGTVLGIGMGGFVDGIVLHQIMQVHNMLSAKIPPTTLVNIKINMVWDGLFHAFSWVMTAIGLALLWRAGQQADVPWSTKTLIGSLIFGWGLFNLVEGVIDHHILHLHHVWEAAGVSIYDYGFLAIGGFLFMWVGWSLIKAGSRDDAAASPSPAAQRDLR